MWEGKKKAGEFSRIVYAVRARYIPASRESRCEHSHLLLPTGRNLARPGRLEEGASKLSGKFAAPRRGFPAPRPLQCLAWPWACRSGTRELERGGTFLPPEPRLRSTHR